MNELRAYPEIRERYEFWIFGYATGAPMPYTARRLRMDLLEMQTFRQGRGAPTDDVVLIGHSMGGIMARLMTQRGGDEQWFQVSNKPVDEMNLPKSQRELLKELFYFEPVPFVNRVTFISTPHRGSELAENPIGQLGAKLIRLPANLIDLSTNLVQGSFAALTPEGRQLLSEMPNSIQQLSASSEFMKVSAQEPLSSEVIYHSILGDRGKPGPLEESSDGIVPYWSAHRDEAASEIIVPAGHGAHQHPQAIAEVARILIAHESR
jgi:triacylglycerol esterase/lipase EstA (alpha/beta hydrolase family)